jgi:hypothetical protein
MVKMKLKRFTGKLILLAVFMIAMAVVLSPAFAKLQVDITVTDVGTPAVTAHVVCADGDGCDTDPATGSINLASNFEPIPNYVVQGSYHTSTHADIGGSNILTSGSSTVTNNRDNSVKAVVAVSDTDFQPLSKEADVSGSGTFTSAVGSTLNMAWYDDPANVQGADTLKGGPLTPGNLIDSFGPYTATKALDSYSYNKNNIAVADDVNPYSMTLYFDYTLTPKGKLVSRGQAEAKDRVPVPEFPTLAAPLGMIVGLAGVIMVVKKSEEK